MAETEKSKRANEDQADANAAQAPKRPTRESEGDERRAVRDGLNEVKKES